MTAVVQGIGVAKPESSISQEDAIGRSLQRCVATDPYRRLAPAIYARSGVKKRHSVLLESSTNGEPAQQSFYHPPTPSRPFGPTTGERMVAYRESASDLAEKAALTALEAAAIPRDRVSHIVLVTCSGFDAPGVDVALIQRLGLRPTTSRTSVGFMGCHGAINGMRVAKAYCEADPAAVVLLVAVELCSLHYQYDWTPERIIANALFSDGAAAAVISSGSANVPRIASTFSEIVPDSQDAMSWKIGDHGFTMTLAPRVPELIESSTRAPIERWLAGEGLRLSDIADWAVHPGGPRILDAAGTALGLLPTDLDVSRQVLAECGNMSSPTVLFILEQQRSAGRRGPCVVLGFGPGLAIEAALLV
jgi:predicted naringenin-chalcone synthase